MPLEVIGLNLLLLFYCNIEVNELLLCSLLYFSNSVIFCILKPDADVKEHVEEQVIYLKNIKHSLLVEISGMRHDVVNYLQTLVCQESIVIAQVNHLQKELRHLGFKHHVLPLYQVLEN